MLALQFKSILFGEPHDARHLNAVTNITDRAAILCPRSILYEHCAPLPPRIYKFNFARCEIYDRLPVSLNFQTLQFSPVISHLYIYISGNRDGIKLDLQMQIKFDGFERCSNIINKMQTTDCMCI